MKGLSETEIGHYIVIVAIKGRLKMKIKASYYQQFDADLGLDVPGEGYGGWGEADIEISLEHTAVVVMHAWDCGTPEQYPGWFRCVEYIPRAEQICREVFPPLLDAVRRSPMKLYHVVRTGDHYKRWPGYARAVDLAKPPNSVEHIPGDESLDKLAQFRREHVFVGLHNEADVAAGFANIDFATEAMPVGDEGIAEDSEQLFALCREDGVNHLIYAGFAIDGCLLISPGGMVDMSRRGIMCSALRDAVTAIENKETAREEICKQIALWRVALFYGFVFQCKDLIEALAKGEG
jgi:nicotinamidase-related amidase